MNLLNSTRYVYDSNTMYVLLFSGLLKRKVGGYHVLQYVSPRVLSGLIRHIEEHLKGQAAFDPKTATKEEINFHFFQ